MRYPKDQKQATRQRILEAAGRRFKQDGIDGAGVAAVMSDAGLTNGAFYAHFDSKDDLVATVVGEHVGDQILLGLEVGIEAAVGQAGIGHHGGDAGAVDAVLFEAPSGCFEDALSGGLLLVLGVAHREPLSSNCSRSCWDLHASRYCIMPVLL